jgi:hypothetical protein
VRKDCKGWEARQPGGGDKEIWRFEDHIGKRCSIVDYAVDYAHSRGERGESSQRIVVVHLVAFKAPSLLPRFPRVHSSPPILHQMTRSPTLISARDGGDYTYDFPVPSTSKLSSPVPPRRRRRSQSPTKLHLPHSLSKHSPSTRESDVSRLLDPTYSSSSKNASNAPYVDHHGDLHDPDYRHFPPVPQHLTKPLTRPRWELATNDAIDEEDDTIQVDAFSIIRPASPRRHRDSTSTYRAAPSYASSYPHSTFTAPTSLDSDETVLEEDDDPFDDNEKPSRCPATKKSKKHQRRLSSSTKPPIEPEMEEEARPIITSNEPAEEYLPSKAAEEQDWT